MIDYTSALLLTDEQEAGFLAYMSQLDNHSVSSSDSSSSLQANDKENPIKQVGARASKYYLEVSRYIRDLTQRKTIDSSHKDRLLSIKEYLENKIARDAFEGRNKHQFEDINRTFMVRNQQRAQKARDKKKMRIVDLCLRIIEQSEIKNKLLEDLKKAEELQKKNIAVLSALGASD